MKEIRCRDLGFSDDFVARGQTEEEVMEKLSEHARKEHGMERIDEDLRREIQSKIRET